MKRTNKEKGKTNALKKVESKNFNLMLLVTFFLGVLLIFSAYAWFYASLDVQVKFVNLVVSKKNGLFISLDGVEFGSSVQISRENLISQRESAINELDSYVNGSLDGKLLTITTSDTSTGTATITSSDISENSSTITITPTNSGIITAMVKYTGDNNHNESNTKTFIIDIRGIFANLVVNGNVGGTGKVNGVIDSSTNEVELNANITFTATPADNYALAKYVVGTSNTPVYITNAEGREITDVFTSPTITINDELLGNVNNKDNTSITITLYFFDCDFSTNSC